MAAGYLKIIFDKNKNLKITLKTIIFFFLNTTLLNFRKTFVCLDVCIFFEPVNKLIFLATPAQLLTYVYF